VWCTEAVNSVVRNRIAKSSANLATSEQIIAEVLATVICVTTASQRYPGVEVSLSFTRNFSSTRRHTGLTEAEARAGTAAVRAALRQGLSEDRYRYLIRQLPAECAGLGRAVG
jgi:hypothetical protein